MHAKMTRGRQIAAVCVILFFFMVFAVDLINLQIVKGDEYDAASSAVSAKTGSHLRRKGRDSRLRRQAPRLQQSGLFYSL